LLAPLPRASGDAAFLGGLAKPGPTSQRLDRVFLTSRPSISLAFTGRKALRDKLGEHLSLGDKFSLRVISRPPYGLGVFFL
jgi:hypothetical protein